MNGLLDYSTYIFDLDGCVYFGPEPAQGASGLISLLSGLGKRVLFLSNNSTHSPHEVVQKLQSMDIHVLASDIHLASTLLARYLFETHGSLRLAVAGESFLHKEMARFNHTLVPLDDTSADCLVMGRYLTFTFDRLVECVRQVDSGGHFYVTNLDTYHPGPGGARQPETGALAAAVSAVTGKTPFSVGKPFPYAFTSLLNDLALDSRDCLMIGDSLNTDVLGAGNAGLDTCWLNPGGASETPSDQPNSPTFTFPGLAEVLATVQQEVR